MAIVKGVAVASVIAASVSLSCSVEPQSATNGLNIIPLYLPVGTSGSGTSGSSGTSGGVAAVTIIPYESDVAIGTGNGKVAYTVPLALNGKALTAAIASQHTLGSAGTTNIQIRKRSGGSDTDMLSALITLDYNEYYIADGTIKSDGSEDVATGDQVYVDIDAASDATGLSVTLTFA